MPRTPTNPACRTAVTGPIHVGSHPTARRSSRIVGRTPRGHVASALSWASSVVVIIVGVVVAFAVVLIAECSAAPEAAPEPACSADVTAIVVLGRRPPLLSNQQLNPELQLRLAAAAARFRAGVAPRVAVTGGDDGAGDNNDGTTHQRHQHQQWQQQRRRPLPQQQQQQQHPQRYQQPQPQH